MRKRKIIFSFIFSFAFLGSQSICLAAEPKGCLSDEEVKLAKQINDYRNKNGLPSVSISKSLTLVAQWHVIDLYENSPDNGKSCNMHSWSNTHPTLWSAVCYTKDPPVQIMMQMWAKPGQITKNAYTDRGYEIAHCSCGTQAKAEVALTRWKNSEGHNDIILQKNIWFQKFHAMGVAIYKSYAVVWFGKEADPQGIARVCSELPAVIYMKLPESELKTVPTPLRPNYGRPLKRRNW